MADGSLRIQILFVDRTETRLLGEQKPRNVRIIQTRSNAVAESNTNCPPSLDGSGSTVSTGSGDTGHKFSDASSQKSAPATSVTSISAAPTGVDVPRTLDQQLQQMSLPDYTLPCEFLFTGCTAVFRPSDHEDWIAHTFEHLTHDIYPPSKTVCIFCDTKFDCSETETDPMDNWRLRMDHIHDHFRGGELAATARPDFFVLNHMQMHGLISREKHDHLTTYSERPFVDGLRPRGWEPDSRRYRRERETQVEHDLQKERRLLKKNGRTKLRAQGHIYVHASSGKPAL